MADSSVVSYSRQSLYSDPASEVTDGATAFLERTLPSLPHTRRVIRYLFTVGGVMRFRANWFDEGDGRVVQTHFLRVKHRGDAFSAFIIGRDGRIREVEKN